jgi:hypothetical protein
MKKSSIYEELERARLAIAGALANPEMIKALTPLGFDRKEILKGQELQQSMQLMQQARLREENGQKESTQQVRNAFDLAFRQYMDHVKQARLIFAAVSREWNDLKLGGTRSRNLASWISEAKAFYQNALPLADRFAQRGILAEELAQAQAMIEAVADARVRQNKSRSSYQIAKEKRDSERIALQQWMRKFVKAARYAFDDDPQQLEALGIVVRATL